MNNHQQESTITVIANGQPRSIAAGSTIADLLHAYNITPSHVVVQLDGNIVPRTDIQQVTLHDGSKIEIVTLVGGG